MDMYVCVCGMGIKLSYRKHMFLVLVRCRNTHRETERERLKKKQTELIVLPVPSTQNHHIPNLYDPNYWINGWMKMVHKNVTWAWNFATWIYVSEFMLWAQTRTKQRHHNILSNRKYNFNEHTPLFLLVTKNNMRFWHIIKYKQQQTNERRKKSHEIQ